MEAEGQAILQEEIGGFHMVSLDKLEHSSVPTTCGGAEAPVQAVNGTIVTSKFELALLGTFRSGVQCLGVFVDACEGTLYGSWKALLDSLPEVNA